MAEPQTPDGRHPSDGFDGEMQGWRRRIIVGLGVVLVLAAAGAIVVVTRHDGTTRKTVSPSPTTVTTAPVQPPSQAGLPQLVPQAPGLPQFH